ncbi:MAG: SDR family NAD(P)-dependent oxidoreductase [Dehalococcoidales bacterium]|nr:SDR family NAD(P)-dependent oxidoreductase [Dehalococcoidales bacterium]
MKDFAGKVAFITGGASGAGLGQAKVFSEAGCKIVIADIRQDHIDEALAYFRDKKAEVHAIKMDVTNRDDWKKAAEYVEKLHGCPPQLLFLTAGVNAFGPCEASTFEDYDWVVGVNLFGVINGLVTFVPRMIQAGRGGYIVTTASMGGFMGTSGCAPYSAAKAAVINLMDSYYHALKPYGIGVSCLCPGGIRSNIGESHLTRPKHLQNTGYHLDDKVVEFMHKHYSYGIDPVELAKITKKGIEDEVLYIIPVPEPDKFMRGVLERMVNYTTAEGMKRQEELDRKRREEMRNRPNPMMEGARESGWGTARKDITWVKPREY